MRILTFRSPDGLRLGIKTDNGVLDVTLAAEKLGRSGSFPRSVSDLIAGGDAALRSMAQLVLQAEGDLYGGAWLMEEHLKLGPCLPNPGKILCIGLNYRRHAIETGNPIPIWPVLFAKFNNTVGASGDEIGLPEDVSHFDYEVELGVVIGIRTRYVLQADALDHVWGYCTANDLSERILQARSSQWVLGKSIDGFMPIGPYLVTRDEVPDPQALRLRAWVNEELRQDSTTAEMVFSVRDLVSYVSRYITMEPGDLILTGTPEGVIAESGGKIPWLSEGDHLVLEVEGLGRLRNTLTRQTPEGSNSAQTN